jgi:hypothetical protein
MKKLSSKKSVKIGAALALGTVMGVAATSQAAHGLIRDCLPGVYCLDVWLPVICSDGNVYSNSCYAAKACQTNCVPYEIYE